MRMVRRIVPHRPSSSHPSSHPEPARTYYGPRSGRRHLRKTERQNRYRYLGLTALAVRLLEYRDVLKPRVELEAATPRGLVRSFWGPAPNPSSEIEKQRLLLVRSFLRAGPW